MQRIHVPGRVWSRRRFLGATGLMAAWPILGNPTSAFALQQKAFSDYPFALGVASGDPEPESVVIWTRLAPKPLEGGGMPQENVLVGWEVADDEAMAKTVARGTAVATPELAHSVHVDVPGLEPGRWYFYRFTAGGEASPIGRTRTAPRRDELPVRFRFAFASCQHFEAGYYTAYDHLQREAPDLIAHLGDYIYEGPSREGQVRQHVGPLLRTLADYRNRHAQYKTDKLLQAAHAVCPWIVTWDDHELANNYAGDVPNKKADVDGFLERRTAAYQAYYEHMPIRSGLTVSGSHLKLHRKIDFGRLVRFSILDTRQYRTPDRDSILGPVQERWLYQMLDESPAVWNSVAQQVLMARIIRPNRDDKMAAKSDQWRGYEPGRQRLLNFFASRPNLNPIVLTGDSHRNWVNNLQTGESDEQDPVVATEFAGTSISSSGDGAETVPGTDELLAANPFLRYFNQERGYVSCEVTPAQWTAHYRTVPYVTMPGAPIVTRRTFVVEPGKAGAQQA